MANTLIYFPQPAGAVQPIIFHPGIIPFKVTTTETYATATGGFTISAANWAALLSGAGIERQVKPADVVFVMGSNTLGYRATFTLVADGTVTVRLWNGATELSDGAITTQGIIIGLIFFSPGSPS